MSDEEITAVEAQKRDDAAKKKNPPAPAPAPTAKEANLYRRKTDRLLYALKIVADKPPFLGRTHVANNTKSHWAGTQAQFVSQFEPEAGSGSNDPKPSTGPVPEV